MPQMESPPGAETTIDGRRYLYFAGTGYLGLQGHPAVIRAAREAVEKYGIGSATSRTLAGDTPPVLEVERRAAQFFGTEDAFYFASGYMAPAVCLSLLGDQFDLVLIDGYAHSCMKIAAASLRCEAIDFAHGDVDNLARCLKRHAADRTVLVMTDGVFSALGKPAPLADYWQLLQDTPQTMLLVDDAHGYGVLGDHGHGSLEHTSLVSETPNSRWAVSGEEQPALWHCGTLSKALGGFGGIVPGTSRTIDALRSHSPYGSGASAPAVPVAAASAAALKIATEQPELRDQLRQNAAQLKSGLRRLGFKIDDSLVPIVALEFDTADRMRHIQTTLAQRGIWIAYVPAYSGVGPEGLLRLAVFATHTPEMIDCLLDELSRIV